VDGRTVYWQQHDSMVLSFTNGGQTAEVNERNFSYTPACGYGTDTVKWTAASQLPATAGPSTAASPPANASPIPTATLPAPTPLHVRNLDPSLSPDARRRAPLAAAAGAISQTTQTAGPCPSTSIPPSSKNLQAAWDRLAALINQAACSPKLDTLVRRREILAMMSAQACYQPLPVDSSAAQDLQYCRQKLDQLIAQTADSPISDQLANLEIVDGRA
jgi:hypothetical protein